MDCGPYDVWTGSPGNHERAQQGWQAMAHRTPDLGFIGLGLMGQAFTKRLVACGHRVTGYDVVADKIARARAHGVRAASSAAEVAAAGKLLIDHSTTEVAVTKAFGARLEAETGMRWVDAPVSGGPPAAEAGTLAIMAGGDEADVTAG